MSNYHISGGLRLHVGLFKFTITGPLNAPRMMTELHFYPAVCGGLSFQILAYKDPLLLVCWRQWLHGSTRLFCIVNISSEQWVQLFFFFFNLALKNAVLIKFSFWHRPSREALLRRRRKTGASEHDRPCWVGGKLSRGGEGGKIICILFLFYTFPFRRTPSGLTLSSAFHRKQAGKIQLSPGLWLRRCPKLLRDVWIHGRQETGGTQYWLWWYRSGRGNESIGQTVRPWSLAQRPTLQEQKGEIK